MDDLKIAAVCMTAQPGKIRKNLDRIRSLFATACDNGARIVCFPELSVTGYVLEHPLDAYKNIELSRVIDALTAMAKKTGAVLIAGLIEDCGEPNPYITQLIAGPKGLIGLYRKTHLSPHERAAYKAGDRFEVYTDRNTLFGVELCYEAHFPEISTITALMGAEIIFIPHASPRGDSQAKLDSWLRHLTARAFDNGVFVVACNQVGDTDGGFSFPGVAVVVGPDGQVLAQMTGDKEMILYSSLEAKVLHDVRSQRMRYFISSRRSELYTEIIRRKKSE